MKKETKQGRPLCRMLGTALAVWAVLLGTVWCARKWGGAVVFLLFALLAVGGAAVFLLRHVHSGILRRGCAAACVLSLCLSLLPVQAAAVSGSLSDANIGMSDVLTEGTAPSSGSGGTGSSGGWDAGGTTITGTVTPGYRSESSGGGCGGSSTTYYYYSGVTTTLTLTNNSGEDAILSFDYTLPGNGGSLSIDGTSRTSAGSFSKTLSSGGSVTVVLTTSNSPASTSDESAGSYTASTTLSSVALTPLNANVSVTLSAVTAGGSYTAKTGSTALTVGQTYEYPASTSYTFTAAADVNYVFDGWYVNGVKTADSATYTRTFAETATVEARFVKEPLFSVTTVGGDGGVPEAYLEFDSAFIHSETGCRHTTVGDLNTNNSYGTQATFPYRNWTADGTAIRSSWSGSVDGDNQTSMGFSNARAWLYSDVIRVKALQACIVTFDFSMSAGTVDNAADYPTAGVYAYTYVTTSASANTSTITANGTLIAGGAKSNNGSASPSISLNAGDYLYIYCYAETLLNSLTLSGYATDDVSYSTAISNFTVTPNDTLHSLTVRNADNTGAALRAGSIKVNGAAQSVASSDYVAQMASGSALTLEPGTAPSGYTFIGWRNATTGETVYTSSEYPITMTQDTELLALYVPAMTITTGGANGYESATYTYQNLSGTTVTPNGQYVARNSDCTAFYTTLADAFAGTDTVVLLAGDTISGDLTIPAGKTLVIPYRLADPGSVEPEQVTSPATMTNYCAVTYTGGTLTVNGTLVVSGAQAGNSPMGVTSGGIGYLKMDDSAGMTVNGVLSVSGLIRGGSRITVNSGADVYELMVIADFRSLLLTESFISDKRVFPFNNFYIKNIEDVPVTYHAGADLYARYSMRLQGMDTNTTGEIPVISTSGALFNVTQGTFTKTFDLSTDKTTYCLDKGAVGSTGNFSITMTYSLMGMSQTMTVDTADYAVPLNAGFQIQVDGDLTVNSDFKFLPGAVLSVSETGICTVAGEKNVFIYRLNDYDNRRGGSGTTYQGFGSSGYPVSARNFPAGGYSHPTIDTVGSARLNVDGKMIVNGGLYVTDMLCEDAYSSGYKDNGYNVLTGTGSIDFTNASTSTTYVEEGMQASGSNDPQYVQVTVTPIAGLPREAADDTSDSYFAFSAGNIYYGAYRPVDGGIYVWSDTPFTKVATIYTSEGAGQSFITLADAVAEYDVNDGGYIQLIDNVTENVTIGKTIYLDLAGHTLNGTVTISDGNTLYGMDSSSDGTDSAYAEPLGSITSVTGTGTVAVFCERPHEGDTAYQRYAAIQGDDGSYTFHRFNLSVTGYRFEMSADQGALIFLGTFRGDAAVTGKLEPQEVSAYLGSEMTSLPLTDLQWEGTAGEYRFQFYKTETLETIAATYADPIEVYAVVAFRKDDGENDDTTCTSETHTWSWREAWENGELDLESLKNLQAFLAAHNITDVTLPSASSET